MHLPTVELTREEIISLPDAPECRIYSGGQRSKYKCSNGQLLLLNDQNYPDGAIIEERKAVRFKPSDKIKAAPERLPDDHVERYTVKGNGKAKLTYSSAYDTILQQETWNIENGQRFVRPRAHGRLFELNRQHSRIVEEMKRAGKL